MYNQTIWIGEKERSRKSSTAISQLLASFPQGIKDFAEQLEAQALSLAQIQNDPRQLAQKYCEKYERRKQFTQEQKEQITPKNNGSVVAPSIHCGAETRHGQIYLP